MKIIRNKRKDIKGKFVLRGRLSSKLKMGEASEYKKTGPIVGEAHAFVLLITRSVGLAPVKFFRIPSMGQNCPARWLVNFSKSYCVLSCIVVTVMVCFSIVGLIRELSIPVNTSVRHRSMTARVVGSGDILAVLVTSVVGVYGAPKRIVRLIRVFELLAQVDNSLGYKLVRGGERNLCLIIIAVLIAWTCLLIDDFGLYANQAKKVHMEYELLKNYIAFYLLYYVVVLVEVQFAFMAYSIFLRLKRLNRVLADTGRNLSLINDKSDNLKTLNNIFSIKLKPVVVGPKKFGNIVDALGMVSDENDVTSQEPSECLRRLSDLHGTLCAAAREVDISYGLPVLIILISTLLHLIVTPYFLILELGGSHRPHYLVLQFLWCSAHALRLFMLVEPCHRTKNEAAKTSDIVGEMLGHCHASNSVLRRLELFSRQLLHRTPGFTALGVCSLDRPLIASVTAAVTTYLVILIQFQKQDDLDTKS